MRLPDHRTTFVLFYFYFISILLQITTVTARHIRTQKKKCYEVSISGIENYEQFNLPVEAGVRRIYCLAESTLLQPTCKRYVICRKTYSSLSVVATPTLKLYVVSPCMRISVCTRWRLLSQAEPINGRSGT